jgi:hypothetical protein
VLLDDETRSYALSGFRQAGFSADDFGHLRKARENMAEMLTLAEDMVESRHPRRDRSAMRALRRRLELELWP